MPEIHVFYYDGEKPIETDFMRINCTVAGLKEISIAGQDVQSLQLEYKDSPVTMTIFLPKERNGLQTILKSQDLASELEQGLRRTEIKGRNRPSLEPAKTMRFPFVHSMGLRDGPPA